MPKVNIKQKSKSAGKLKAVSKAVAERQLELVVDGAKTKVVISVSQPVPAGKDWSSDISIGIGKSSSVKKLFGADSLQALTLALKILEVEVQGLKAKYKGNLTWLGQENVWL